MCNVENFSEMNYGLICANQHLFFKCILKKDTFYSAEKCLHEFKNRFIVNKFEY